MVKENTHLFAAHQILKKIKNPQIKSLIKKHLDCYYLGSIFPDIFYYSSQKKIKKISQDFHTKKGHRFLLRHLLNSSRPNPRPEDLAFLFGYLTHYALDQTFHPYIDSLSHPKKSQSAYFHYHFETLLDQKLNSSFYIDKVIKPSSLKDLFVLGFLFNHWKIPQKQIIFTLKKQLFFNYLFRKKFVFYLYYFLSKMNTFNKKYLSLFYSNLKKEPASFSNQFIPLLSKRKLSLSLLLKSSFLLAEKMIDSAYFSSRRKSTKFQRKVY